MALKGQGIQVILSLRDDREEFGRVAGRDCGAYCADDERALWEGRGFSFVHVRFTDFEAPEPPDLANALRALDREVEAGRGVYVHCRAGVGRTGMVTCTWLMTRGTPGDEAAGIYLRFADDSYLRNAVAYEKEGQTPPTREQHAKRVGFRYQWWALHQVAAALGTPITRQFAIPEPAETPAGLRDSWDLYAEHLAPWRTARYEV